MNPEDFPLSPATRPERLRRLQAAAGGILLLAAVGIFVANLSNLGDLGTLLSALHRETDPVNFSDFLADSYDLTSGFLFKLWLALWMIPVIGWLALFTTRPALWTNLRAFTAFIIAAAALAGYPASASIYALLGLAPNNLWTGILRILAPPLLLPFAGLASVAGLVAGISALTAGAIYLLLELPLQLVDYLDENGQKAHIRRQRQNALIAYIERFRFWAFGLPMPALPPDDSRGARLAVDEEIARISRPDDPKSMAFGHHLGSPLFLQTDKHVLIMASTRSGKGVTLIIPHLLRYQGSAFVLDPKGENAKATGRRRSALNRTVHYLDPFGISGKPQSRFNPLARFTPDNMEAESKALAAALFLVGERERDHWTAAGQQLLAAIILYVYVSGDIPKAKKDLPTVRRILLGGLKRALNAMTLMDEADGLLRDLAISFIETPEREFGSIVSTVQRQTEILDNPAMIACLSASGPGPEVDFRDWHRDTMTVYLCLSAPKFPTFSRWLRLVLTSALDEMTDRLAPPPLPVCFMLDELATLGHLPAVENAIGLAAGYGIQLVSVFQDVAQMRDLYKGRWASFVGNAGVRALFNLDDFETAEYWSKFIGGRIAKTFGRHEDQFGLSRGQNVGETMRPLFSPDRIMLEFASGKMLVLTQGQHPIGTERMAYFRDASLNELWDDPRQVVL